MKKNNQINCNDCGIHDLCLPALLADVDISNLDSIIQRSSRSINKGFHIFNTGDSFQYIYAVRSGAFKSYVNSYSGEEQIFSFHLPGELIGLDAIYSNIHCSSAVALEESQICRIPYEFLDENSVGSEGLKSQVMKLLSKEITEDQQLLMQLGQMKAKEKMAALLINLSIRYEARNLPHDLFTLPMSRGEIANYLGLTIETVSRVFRELKGYGFIKIKGKKIVLKDIPALKHLAGIFVSNNPNENAIK